MSASSQIVRIFHFDDEVNTVSMIPNSLCNYFVTRGNDWVRDEVLGKRYVESFVLAPPGQAPVRVEYKLTDNVEQCRGWIGSFDAGNDVAIFDLMRQTDEGIEPIGLELYQETRGRNVSGDRIFVLTGFPHFLVNAISNITIPDDQIFLKPTPSIEVVVRLVRLFPESVRI
jgi:hypothetical protein